MNEEGTQVGWVRARYLFKKKKFHLHLKNHKELAEPEGSGTGTDSSHSSYSGLKVEGGLVGLGMKG